MPMTGRCRLAVQWALFIAPLRTAASTTTVPSASAAVIRFLARNPAAGGRRAGRALGDDQAALRDGVEELRMCCRVSAIGAAWDQGDGGSAGDHSAAVGGLVDAVRRPADDGLSHGCEISAEIAGQLQAVARRGS